MGLAGPRKKTKISHDPNNTKWARSTSGFGHRIMSAQGWTPGSLLGARDAAHADMLTAASATHIKVAVKDDTLGLGARAGRDPLGEPMGLDAFKGLLGRLNGKSDVELKQEQRQRDDVKLARYAAMKFQGVRFVSGGLLTQEKVELPASTPSRKQKKDKSQAAGDFDPTPSHSKTTRKSSKKSRSQGDEADSSVSTSDSKKKTKYKKRKADAETADSSIENSKEESQGDVRRERRPMGRHVIRGRHIAQKKKALLDDQSLNEIFMVKA